MSLVRALSLLAAISPITLFHGCSGAANVNTRQHSPAANTSNTNVANTNVEELGLLVKVPYEAEDIVWREFAAAKRVVAVLRFSPADSSKLVAAAEAFGTYEAVTIAVETWFPEELTAQGEASGDGALTGRSYPANAFFQEPYSTGRVTRIDGTDYFVLDVAAK